MYHTQTSPTMVNSGGAAARQKRRYDFHPYSVNGTDVGKTITSSPSSTIIKSESWENEQNKNFTPLWSFII